jgi:hypothetical protein
METFALNSIDVFLQIIRLGIGHSAECIFGKIDWNNIEALAEQQGLSAILVDGVEKLPDNQRPPKDILLQWIGNTLQSYEYRFEVYRRCIAELAEFYNIHGFQMMVLKGYACAIEWPKPEHRPCGDIDIWLFGQQKEADAVLTKEKGVEIDNRHHHHSVFYWQDFIVENHYDFINVHSRSSNKDLEKVFKKLGEDDTYYVGVYGEKVYLPSPNLHALFLIRHMVAHFTSTSVNLRQVLDWGFFVEKNTQVIDWVWLTEVLKNHHIMDFFNIVNAFCVEEMGFDSRIFPAVQFLPELKQRVIRDMLDPKYSATEPVKLLPRLIYKYRRWQGNAWKQNICYKESRWSVFWSGLMSHLMKPTSI